MAAPIDSSLFGKGIPWHATISNRRSGGSSKADTTNHAAIKGHIECGSAVLHSRMEIAAGKTSTGKASPKIAKRSAEDERALLIIQAHIKSIFKEQCVVLEIQGQSTAVDDLTPEEATKAISPDGYWGAEKTSDRIVNMAIAAAGGDPQKLAAAKQAMQQGFEKAKEAFGGWLPDLCSETIAKALEKFDTFMNSQPQHVVPPKNIDIVV